MALRFHEASIPQDQPEKKPAYHVVYKFSKSVELNKTYVGKWRKEEYFATNLN